MFLVRGREVRRDEGRDEKKDGKKKEEKGEGPSFIGGPLSCLGRFMVG